MKTIDVLNMGSRGPKISRRTFSVGLLAGGMAGSLPHSMKYALAGEVPKYGGLVRLAVTQQSTGDTFDSARFDKSNDYIRGTCVYSYLTTINQAGEAQPEVATEWEPNDTATRWAFKFRQGITFSDGSPLRVEDVVFSIMRHLDEKVASSAKQLAANIKSVTADGPDGFVVELNSPDVDLPILIGLFQFALVKDGTTEFQNPIGTGPFQMVEFQPGLRTVMERNPNYWKNGLPYVDRIEMFPIPDNSARVNALLSGDVEMVLDLRSNGIQEVEQSDVADVFVTESTRYTALQAMMDRAPSNNVDLTLAFAHLMDRERMLNTVLRGYGTLANDHPIGPASPLYNSELPQREYDVDRANYHFKRSEIGNAAIELSVSDGVFHAVDIGQLLQREASRIGMNLSLRREPSESYWTAVAGQRPYAMTNFHPRPTYNMLLDLSWRRGAVWNFSNYVDERLEQLLDESRATLDMELRRQQYWEIQSIIHNSGAIMIPTFLSYVDGISKKVKGLEPLHIGALGGFNFADKIWLDP